MNILRRQQTGVETAIGVGVLACLCVVIAGVLFAQRDFNPAVRMATRAWTPVATAHTPGDGAPVGRRGEFAAFAPAGVVEFGPVEQFDEDTLSDKINGKADLYLTAGFKQMRCQRFALADSEEEWFEWFVYDMDTLPQAFAVYSMQRRAEAKPSDLTELAYTTKNAIYFVSGQYYIEVVASEPTERLLNAMLAMSRNYVASNKTGPAILPELSLFTPENMVPFSQALQIATAFGFDGFSNVFTAKYNVDGKQVMAYLTVLAEPQQAAELAAAYSRFLLENGGREVATAGSLPGAKMISLLGSYEVVFSHHNVVAGVHAAHSQQAAEQVAVALLKHMASKTGAEPN